MNKKLIFGILAVLVIGLFVVAMYSADVVRGEERTAAEDVIAVPVDEVILDPAPADISPTRTSEPTSGGGAASPTGVTVLESPQDLEELFLSRLPEELRNQVLEMKRTVDPVEALMMRVRELSNTR